MMGFPCPKPSSGLDGSADVRFGQCRERGKTSFRRTRRYKGATVSPICNPLNPTNSIMTRPVTKVIYKPDSQSTEEFTIIVIPEEVRSLLRLVNRIFISCV